jgi:hypothetical protein
VSENIYIKTFFLIFLMTLCIVLLCHLIYFIVRQVINTAHLSSTLPSDQLIKKKAWSHLPLFKKAVESKAFPNFKCKGANQNNTERVNR